VALYWEVHISALPLLKVFWSAKVLRLVERDKTTAEFLSARLRDDEMLPESLLKS